MFHSSTFVVAISSLALTVFAVSAIELSAQEIRTVARPSSEATRRAAPVARAEKSGARAEKLKISAPVERRELSSLSDTFLAPRPAFEPLENEGIASAFRPVPRTPRMPPQVSFADQDLDLDLPLDNAPQSDWSRKQATAQDQDKVQSETAPSKTPQGQNRPPLTMGRRSIKRPISDIGIDIATADKRLPRDRSVSDIAPDSVPWDSIVFAPRVYEWDSPNIYYRKLYFEDVAVERYGQVPPGLLRQGFRVTVHWGGTLLALPLNMRLDPYYDCDTPLGYCRPGDCVPPTYQKYLRR